MWEDLNVNHQRKDNGISPAFLAAAKGHLKVLEYLYHGGADLFVKCHYG